MTDAMATALSGHVYTELMPTPSHGHGTQRALQNEHH